MKKYLLIISLVLFNSVLHSQMPPPPVLGPNERYTNLYSVSYDYQSMGSVRYLVEDPTVPYNLCAILMAQQDSTTPAGIQRYVYFSYSDDNGNTWSANSLSESATFGFPCVTLSDGIPVISAWQSGTTGMRVWKDVVFGAFSFSELAGIQPIIGPTQPMRGIITGTSNGNLVMAATTVKDNTIRTFYNTYSGSGWSNWNSANQINSSLGNFTVASGHNGMVGIFGSNFDNNNKIFYYKSTNNGMNFDGGTMIFDYLLSGSDTLYSNPVGGMQAVYSADNSPHLVFTVYGEKNYLFPNPYTKTFVSPKILHWSPLTGVTLVAGRENIFNLTDTITNSLVAPLCQPSVMRMIDDKLVCTFTAYLRGNTQTVDNGEVLNTGEIMYSASVNNGSTWSYPSNFTNTPNIEEKNSSLSQFIGINLRIFYLRDMKAGCWVFNPAWGKAPVYGIYWRYPFENNVHRKLSETSELSQNTPNPFNPETVIRYSLSESRFTTLIVYDALGKEVARLVNENLQPGNHESVFNAGALPSGMYYYKLTSGNFSEVKKMLLIK